MKAYFSDPPEEIAEIDYAPLIEAVRQYGTVTYAKPGMIANRIFRVEIAGLVVVTDYRGGKGCRLFTRQWQIRGRYVYDMPVTRFQCTSFNGDAELCLREAALLRVML